MARGDQQAHEVLPAHRDPQGLPVPRERPDPQAQQARKVHKGDDRSQGPPGLPAVTYADVTAFGGDFDPHQSDREHDRDGLWRGIRPATPMAERPEARCSTAVSMG